MCIRDSPTILNRLTGMFSEDRSEFIASFDEYDLLIIDDLGVERSTESVSYTHLAGTRRNDHPPAPDSSSAGGSGSCHSDTCLLYTSRCV